MFYSFIVRFAIFFRELLLLRQCISLCQRRRWWWWWLWCWWWGARGYVSNIHPPIRSQEREPIRKQDTKITLLSTAPRFNYLFSLLHLLRKCRKTLQNIKGNDVSDVTRSDVILPRYFLTVVVVQNVSLDPTLPRGLLCYYYSKKKATGK